MYSNNCLCWKKKFILKINIFLIKELYWKFISYKDCNFIFNVNFYLFLEVYFGIRNFYFVIRV